MRIVFTKYVISCSKEQIENINKFIRRVYSKSFGIEISRWLLDLHTPNSLRSSYEFAIISAKNYGFDVQRMKTLLISCVDATDKQQLFNSMIAVSDEISSHIAYKL